MTDPAPTAAPQGDLLTVDELAAATGTTVRNTRYYAGLGLLPPPQKRGRVAFYDHGHKARLELIRALQEHGFTLAAIDRYLSRLPEGATPEDLAAHRVMLTSWKPAPVEVATPAQLEVRAGRSLDAAELDVLERIGAIRSHEATGGTRYEVTSGFDAALRLLALAIPVDSLLEANEAITRHMEQLADELTGVLRTRVMAPFRSQEHTDEDTARFEEMMTELRELTMEAVVSGYQRAADEVIRRSLSR